MTFVPVLCLGLLFFNVLVAFKGNEYRDIKGGDAQATVGEESKEGDSNVMPSSGEGQGAAWKRV